MSAHACPLSLLMSSYCPQTVRAAMIQRQRHDDAENEKVWPRREGLVSAKCRLAALPCAERCVSMLTRRHTCATGESEA